jgi:glycosyltransferase involved in cell wall biosynthesis
MIYFHKLLGTWKNKIDIYIVLSIFAKKMFIKGGLPKNKLIIKPNFVVNKNFDDLDKRRKYVVFVGRLSAEKGVKFLVETFQDLPDIQLKIIGDGPLNNDIQDYIRNNNLKNIHLAGYRNSIEVNRFMKSARFLILPSLCYEGFPMVICEAYSLGLPVLASNLGSLPELIVDGVTGLLFNPGDKNDLKYKIRKLWHSDDFLKSMGMSAKSEFERKYSGDINIVHLLKIYKHAIQLNQINKP